MTILPETSRPIAVGSAAIAERIEQTVALDAARQAATSMANGEARNSRLSLPYEGGWIRIMAVTLPSLDLVGYKEFHLSNASVVRYAVHLFTLSDGRPLGVVDAALVTAMRTAAAMALASQQYFGTGTRVRLGVIGSGAIALSGVRALNAVLNLAEIKVTSRNEANREKFAVAVTEELGLTARGFSSIEEVTHGVDMVYLATNSGGRVVLEIEDARHVPFVASVGSTLPNQRELGDAVLAAADGLVVDTWDVFEESGDAIAAKAHGLDRSRASLLDGSDCSSAWRGEGLTVYKSIGSPEQDVVLANMILEKAAREGFGRELQPLSSIKRNL